MTSSPRRWNFVQAASCALHGHDNKVLVARVVRTIHDAHTDAHLEPGLRPGPRPVNPCLQLASPRFLLVLLWTPLCSPLSGNVSDKLFTRPPRAAPPHAPLTCCAWSGSFQPHSEEDSSSSKHCAWKSVIPELGCSCSVQSSVGHLVVGMVVDSVARVVHFLRVAENALSLESASKVCTANRRSAPLVRLCPARRLPAIGHSSALVRRVSASASGLQSRRSTVRECVSIPGSSSFPQAVAAAYGCVPRGQRAPLDADMLELIDRSACLVEPVLVVSRARASRTEHVRRRVGSLLASVTIARPCGKSCAPNPELLLSLLSQRGN